MWTLIFKGCRRWWPWWIGHGMGYPQGVLGVTCTHTYQHPYPQMKTHGKTRPLIQPWFGSQVVVSRGKKEIDSGHTEMAKQNTSSWFKTQTTRRVSPSLFKMPPKNPTGCYEPQFFGEAFITKVTRIMLGSFDKSILDVCYNAWVKILVITSWSLSTTARGIYTKGNGPCDN